MNKYMIFNTKIFTLLSQYNEYIYEFTASKPAYLSQDSTSPPPDILHIVLQTFNSSCIWMPVNTKQMMQVGCSCTQETEDRHKCCVHGCRYRMLSVREEVM